MFTLLFLAFCLICQVSSKLYDISFDNQTPNKWKLAYTTNDPSREWLKNNFTSEMMLWSYQVSYFHFKIEFYINGFKVGSASSSQRFTVALQTIDTSSDTKEALVFKVDPNPFSSTCTAIGNELLQAAPLNKTTITKVIQCGTRILLKQQARTEMDKVIDINSMDVPDERRVQGRKTSNSLIVEICGLEVAEGLAADSFLHPQ
ncbi:unnamed protein product, partial [Mesorhabditis belari]|uniref:Uncharacterized protein n=1 Tax=Mesorhabditis belari TaxID=2138241 RepID=A0AAF3FJK6_9BILA